MILTYASNAANTQQSQKKKKKSLPPDSEKSPLRCSKTEEQIQAASASEVTRAYFILHLQWSEDLFMGQLI